MLSYVMVLKSLRRGMELRFSVRGFGCALFYFEDKKMIITFCGHSNYVRHKDDEEKILSVLETYSDQKHIDFYLGEYGKFDSFAYSCAKKYKALHSCTRLIFITPYLPPKKTFFQYDEIIYPALENVPPRFAISYRNKWMVKEADVVIAYVCHKFGGAYKTYIMANRANKTVINIGDL